MLIEHLNHQRREREAAGLQRRLRTALSACAPQQTFATADGIARDCLNFCSNDYLGLASHPAVVDALGEGARRYGAGSGASHLVCGHSQAHARLEQGLAALYAPHIPGAQALLLGSGFAANMALLTTLGEAQATLFTDRLNHASLIDGGLLARASVCRYPHGQTDWLARRLATCTSALKFIVTDSVFSMDGDLAPLPQLLALAQAHDAWLVVDDAHGFGVLGAQGLGALEHFGLSSPRLICMGTLGKAAGVGGAFVVAHPAIIDALVQRGRSYIYTTAMPPALAHALHTSLTIITGLEGRQRRAALVARLAQWRQWMPQVLAVQPGWSLPQSDTAIQPLIVGDNHLAVQLAEALEQQGLLISAIRPPTVPVGTARLRITLTAAHTPTQVQHLCDTLLALAQATAAAPKD